MFTGLFLIPDDKPVTRFSAVGVWTLQQRRPSVFMDGLRKTT